MPNQVYSWTCSVCTFTWIIQATGIDPALTRDKAAEIIGYPDCVNDTYGLMSADCLIKAFNSYGLEAKQGWYTWEQAFAISQYFTGAINPTGMYHFMAIRGTVEDKIWVANSAPGYDDIYQTLSGYEYNQWGPTQMIWLPAYQSE